MRFRVAPFSASELASLPHRLRPRLRPDEVSDEEVVRAIRSVPPHFAAQHRQFQMMGWLAANPSNTTTFQNNNANNWYAMAFTPDANRTFSSIHAYISTTAGTVAAADITATLFSSVGSTGKPNAALEGPKNCSTTLSGANWYDWTGFSTTALTAGTMYYVVFKNANGTPASNNVTFRGVNNAQLGNSTGTAPADFGWGKTSSTDGGSTWASPNNGVLSMRVGYADGTYDGYPFSNVAAAAVGDGVYGTRESGIKFTSPLNSILRVAGVFLQNGGKTGTPTGTMRFGLWTGTTPVNQGYTNTTSFVASSGLTGMMFGYFASPILILPGTVCRITLGETTQSDTSSNYYVLEEVTADTDSNSTPLLPWNGTATKTYFDGSNWTDSTLGTSLFSHALLLDVTQEFNGVPIGQVRKTGNIGTY